MGNKLDSRTGIIVSGPSRPSRFPPSTNKQHPKKSGNMFPAKPLSSREIREPQYLSVKQLHEFAKEIGLTIAEQLKSIQAQSPVIITHGQYTYAAQEERQKPFAIAIDESIIDVGIGDQGVLEKGQGSAKIAKEVKTSDDLAGAKKNLRALKAGK